MERRTQLKLGTRLLLLLCIMGFGLMVASVETKLLIKQSMLAMLTIQDIFAFILPAVVAMALFYLRPLHVMGLDRMPSLKALAVVVVFYLVSLPAMNWLVDFNGSMVLPSWMSGVEEAMRQAEDMAADATKQILDINTIPQLLFCLFVVGLMAGLSEEMLFRGAMQRTMQDSRLGAHTAIWVTAIVFSAFHMQFFGFLPRMLLGAWLGYLFVWTRSLWVPIIAHTLNNSTVVVMSYLAGKGVVPEGFGDNLGLPADGAFPWMATASLMLSIAIALWAARSFRNEKHGVEVSDGTHTEATA
ncbi:MAG: CPBP family intramembrane metalloprotease [Muribaculaceae bacterium]|nr:CPBP family intramembrane metalloprotease [Muribaculaceae bacterium]